MALSDFEKQELFTYLNDAAGSYENTIINKIVPAEKKEEFDIMSLQNVAQSEGMDQDTFVEMMLDRRTKGEGSIYGGLTAIEYYRLCSIFIGDWLLREHDQIRTAICEDLGYCALKKSGAFNGEEHGLAIAICDCIISLKVLLPVPATMLTSYLLRKGILDRWCNC